MSNLRMFNVFNLLLQVLIWNYLDAVQGTGTSTVSEVCSGLCTRDQTECKNQGGKVFGSCENGHTCCDVTWKSTGSCGTTKTGKNPVYFVSPDYPAFLNQDVVCTFGLTMAEDVVAVRIDFVEVAMDGLSYFPRGSSCESDMFVLKGFKTWTPPALCGNLTGYSTLIERTVNVTRMDQLNIVALMSSNQYRWRFKITPIMHSRTTHSYSNKSHLQSSNIHPRRRGKRSIENMDFGTNLIEGDGDGGDLAMGLESPLITNGYNTTSFEVPWQASIRTVLKQDPLPINQTGYTTGRSVETTVASTNETDSFLLQRQCALQDGMHFCGGIIISDRHILTAAHCFYATNKAMDFVPLEDLRVVLGDTNRCTNDSNVQQDYTVDSVTFHYAYDHVGIINDVAVVKLKQPIAFKRNVQKIKMASPKENFEGAKAYISGWGMQNLTEESNGTAEAPLILALNDRFIIRNQSECNADQIRYIGQPADQLAMLPKYQHILDSVICTETVNASLGRAHVGQGDSGGPVVVKSRTGENIVVGIVSHSIPNPDPLNVEEPSDFFASVAFYRNWIDLAMYN